MKNIFGKLILGLILFATFSCSDDDECGLQTNLSGIDDTLLQNDLDALDVFFQENGITPIEDPSGLRYVITSQGSGGTPELCDEVFAAYTGTLLDGSVFDSSNGLALPLTRVILGWQVGFQLLNSGTKATLYIPSQLAYGTAGISGSIIGSNENIVFDVELISF